MSYCEGCGKKKQECTCEVRSRSPARNSKGGEDDDGTLEGMLKALVENSKRDNEGIMKTMEANHKELTGKFDSFEQRVSDLESRSTHHEKRLGELEKNMNMMKERGAQVAQ
eukprot:9391732-Karenia_brevis.AAC.1